MAVSVIVQVMALPEQAPPHPEKPEPLPGAAVRVSWVPVLKVAVQVLGQLMPAGVLETEPEAPVP